MIYTLNQSEQPFHLKKIAFANQHSRNYGYRTIEIKINIIEHLPLPTPRNDLIGQNINYHYHFIIVNKNEFCKTNFITWQSKTPITGLETLISTRKP